MRAIQSERKSRRRTRRPREDCIIARSTASIARLYVPCRRPRKPFASLRTRFLRRRALNPRLTRIPSLLVHHRGLPGGPPRALVNAASVGFAYLLRQAVGLRFLEVSFIPALQDQRVAQAVLPLAVLP